MTHTDIGKSETGVKPVVLIVYDNLRDLERLQKAFKDRYTVYTSASGVEALQLIKSLPEIHVLIVDNDLPRMKGTELFRFLEEMVRKSEGTVKILIAAAAEACPPLDSPAHGRIDYCFTKPVEPEEILKKVSFLLAQRSAEKRSTMRVTLNQTSDIRITTAYGADVQVVNISENGMLLRNLAAFPEGTTLPLKILLPEGKQHVVTARIVRQDPETGGSGVEFLSMDEQNRKWITHFLSDYVTVRDLTDLRERYPFLKTEEMVLFSDSYKIESLMREAMADGVETVALHSHQGNPENLAFAEIKPPTLCVLTGEDLNVKFKTSDLIFISFQIGYATYNFETMVSRISPDGKRLACLYPRVMFYSEKRAARRFSPLGDLSLEILLPPPIGGTVQGRITDISPEGVSFIAENGAPVLLPGTPLKSLRILEGGRALWEEKGEIRNVSRVGQDGDARYRYGIQFGIGRMSIQSVPTPDFDAAPAEPETSEAPAPAPVPAACPAPGGPGQKAPEVIRVATRAGEEIVGLLNSSLPLDENPVPVVIVPPAFGKTKETLFGLALTMTENFRRLGKPLAVVRYDGIRRKGESHKDPEAAEPPYEMLNTNFSQGAADIIAILDWLDVNPRLKASSVILLTFSFSALEARIVLRDHAQRRRIHYWIACMGTPEFRDLMVRVNCGLDFLEHYQLGIKLGIMPVLGNLVNVDPYVADGVVNSVATIEQAREDMRHLDLPITWIYGQYDSWVRGEFIRDVMSIKANAPREVISVPIGHNARTSKEALRLFGTLTSLVHRFLHKTMIQPGVPSRQEMEFMRRSEKDRLPPRNLKNRQSYWRHYLVGEDNLLGFDIMAMSDDYQQLMQDQLLALELRPGDRLLDLGGGTGNFVEHLLESGRELPDQITIADLIPDAMDQARQKLFSRFDAVRDRGRLDFLGLDLEMNRFLPIRRFLEGKVGTFDQLVDRIENLTLESAVEIQKSYSPRLHRILRGEPITPAFDEWLRRQFNLHEYQIINDFNQAARYVRRLTAKKPTFRRLVLPGYLEGNLHLPVKPGWYNKVLMSLVLSYVFNPVETLAEIRRVVRPGGLLVLSSMRPDTDASGPFTRLLRKIETMPQEALPPQWEKPMLLESLRSFLNDAQALVDLEEAGTFDFFDPDELEGLMEEAGWEIIRVVPSYGDPPQGYVAVAKARSSNGQNAFSV